MTPMAATARDRVTRRHRCCSLPGRALMPAEKLLRPATPLNRTRFRHLAVKRTAGAGLPGT